VRPGPGTLLIQCRLHTVKQRNTRLNFKAAAFRGFQVQSRRRGAATSRPPSDSDSESSFLEDDQKFKFKLNCRVCRVFIFKDTGVQPHLSVGLISVRQKGGLPGPPP